MKKLLILILAAALASWFIYGQVTSKSGVSTDTHSTDNLLQNAYNEKKSNVQVQGEGRVIKILKDDVEGSRHQRFILRLSSGQTVLVAHNIDVAPRISGLRIGDAIEFFGEYEWNNKGGVIHWTHRDPGGRHIAGWLKHEGTIYQ